MTSRWVYRSPGLPEETCKNSRVWAGLGRFGQSLANQIQHFPVLKPRLDSRDDQPKPYFFEHKLRLLNRVNTSA